jgi:hypothetical protein
LSWRPHVSPTGLDLAPLWTRLLSGQRARSLALLSMIFLVLNYDRADKHIVNLDQIIILKSCNRLSGQVITDLRSLRMLQWPY